MKHLYLALFCCLLFCCTAAAQQAPVGNFYRTQWQLPNPAAIDRVLMSSKSQHPDFAITANIRPQWRLGGLEGAPMTGFFSFENAPRGPAYKKFPIRWGVTLIGDKTDFLSNWGVYGNYSYELRLGGGDGKGTRKLRLGFSAGALRRQYNNWRPRNPADPLLVQPDNRTYLDASVGAFHQRFRKYGNVTYWGISLPNAFGIYLNRPEDQPLLLEKFRQAYFMWGKYIASRSRDFDNGKLEWEPTIWVRGVPRSHYQYYNIFKKGAPPVAVDATLRMYMGTIVTHRRDSGWEQALAPTGC